MDAIILVGGQGTRLRPLTYSRHKSLVPVANRPAIEYLFAWLRRSGFARIVLAIGQANEDLAAAYPRGSLEGIDLLLVEERSRLESGGAIRNAVVETGVRGRFAVLNGDIYVDFDFAAALEAHEAAGAELTMALARVDDPSQFGVAVLDERGMISGFVEKPPRGEAPGNLVNAGVWIFEPHLVDEIPPGAVRVEETLFPSLVARGRPVLGYEFDGPWWDIGTPARYLALNRSLARAAGGVVSASPLDGAEVLESCIGPGCTVGEGAQISGSVLWEGVSVGTGAVIVDSVLANGVRVGAGARLERVIAGAGAILAENVALRDRVLEPGERYDGAHE